MSASLTGALPMRRVSRYLVSSNRTRRCSSLLYAVGSDPKAGAARIGQTAESDAFGRALQRSSDLRLHPNHRLHLNAQFWIPSGSTIGTSLQLARSGLHGNRLLCAPSELGAIHPHAHAVQDDGQLARDRDHRASADPEIQSRGPILGVLGESTRCAHADFGD